MLVIGLENPVNTRAFKNIDAKVSNTLCYIISKEDLQFQQVLVFVSGDYKSYVFSQIWARQNTFKFEFLFLD